MTAAETIAEERAQELERAQFRRELRATIGRVPGLDLLPKEEGSMTAGLYDLVPAPRRIDYDRMNRELPRVKAALTRAEKSDDPTRVLEAVERFLALSNDVGAMPDNWPRWRNALERAWSDFCRDDDLLELSEDLPGGFVDRFQRAALRFS